MKRELFIAEGIVKLSEADDDWDIKFWQKAGVKVRFSAAWTMLQEFYKIRGKSEIEFRLQKSAENIQPVKSKKNTGRKPR